MIKKKDVDWETLKNEYISDGEASFRSLAEKYEISASVIHRHAKEGDWASKRIQYAKNLETKTLEKLMEERVKGEVKRLDALYTATDKLIKKVSKAIDKVDPKNTLAIRQLTSSLKEMLSIEGVTPPERGEGTNEDTGGVVLITEVNATLAPPDDEADGENEQ